MSKVNGSLPAHCSLDEQCKETAVSFLQDKRKALATGGPWGSFDIPYHGNSRLLFFFVLFLINS